jgi:tetratricopeptide (TPR) repeat protein
MYEMAIEELERIVAVAPDMALALGNLGWAYALSGQTDRALEVVDQLNELSKEKYVSSWLIGIIYMDLERMDEAFDYFEKSNSQGEPLFVSLINAPGFDKIRDDWRYKALLQKMNLQ